jgi:hypothetical protein
MIHPEAKMTTLGCQVAMFLSDSYKKMRKFCGGSRIHVQYSKPTTTSEIKIAHGDYVFLSDEEEMRNICL